LPNFSGNPATLGKPLSEESINQFNALNDELNTLVDERFALDKSLRDARYILNNAKNELPAGDPGIAVAEQSFSQAKQSLTDLDSRITAIRNRQVQLASAPASGNSASS
jgi:predicted  nucleic acid-binding Zn-ribbon protein